MGLELPNPIIASSSGLTASVEEVRKCARFGAGGVVLRSIFEEQIAEEMEDLGDRSVGVHDHPEVREYLSRYGQENAIDEYLDLIREAKRSVEIPVIASIHCATSGVWIEFARKVEQAGADGIELNVFLMPLDPDREGREYEQVYLDIARAVSASVSIPVALKIGTFFSGLAHTVRTLGASGVRALVLFNRFYRFDFDIETLRIVPARAFSSPDEIAGSLRWISLLSGRLNCDLVANTGIHDGAGVIKQLLAGACAVQMCSALYQYGIEHIAVVLEEVRQWMTQHGFETIEDFRGKMSRMASGNPEAYERVQFMKVVEGRL
jgi:dihydroorotate dehydrogenase (fumarate)